MARGDARKQRRLRQLERAAFNQKSAELEMDRAERRATEAGTTMRQRAEARLAGRAEARRLHGSE